MTRTVVSAPPVRCHLPGHARFPVVATATLRCVPRAFCSVCAGCQVCHQLGHILDGRGRVLCQEHADRFAVGLAATLEHQPEAFCSTTHHPSRPAVRALVNSTGLDPWVLDPSTRLCRDCATCARQDCRSEGLHLDVEDQPRCFEHRGDNAREAGALHALLIEIGGGFYRDLLRGGV